MDGIRNVTENLQARLGGLSFNQKVLLGAVATASLISVVVFSLWLQKDEKAVLFTNLSPEDASAALAELAKQDVPAELANGGSTIMVSENMVHRMRVELAAKGLPTSGTVGFEIFDGKQYGLTDFLQNVNFKRALEGELTKSVQSLEGIQSARVHLVLPKPSIFKKLSSEATASVVLQLGRGARLGDQQISGIQSLVAGSVENLSPDQVTVIDQHGAVLSQELKDGDSGRTETQLALRKEVEAYLAGKAGGMLDRVLGPGRSVVQVDASLNFEKIETERETYDPRNTVVRSEVRNETTDTDTGSTDENSTTNFEINRTVERIVGQTGGISKLSVAVFVDGQYGQGPDGKGTVYQPLSEDELNDLRRIVQTAVGLNATRGDQIEVVNMQFRQQEPLETTNPAMPTWIPLVTQYGGKAFLFVMFGILLLSLRRSIGGLLAAGSQGSPRRRPNTSPYQEEPEHFDGIPDMDDQIIGDIRDYASENPERVADVVQSWIHEMEIGRMNRETAGETSER